MARALKHVPPECPRCGYDVSGTIATWTDQCPLEGKCSECGYDFQWKHLLGPNLGVPKWFFETARRRKIRAAISTSVRTLVPWYFWKRVPLHARFNVWRMGLMVGAWFVIAYGAGVIALCGCDLYELVFPLWLHQLPSNSWVPPLGTRIHWYIQRDVLPATAWPLGVKGDRLVPVFETIVLWIVIASVLMPLGFLAVSQTLRTQRVRMLHVIRASVCAWTATMVALATWFTLAFAGLAYERFWGAPRSYYPVNRYMGGEWMLFVWPIILVGWWWFVCRFYLRIRHAFWVALLMQLIAVLGAAVVLYPRAMYPMTWYELGQW